MFIVFLLWVSAAPLTHVVFWVSGLERQPKRGGLTMVVEVALVKIIQRQPLNFIFQVV